MNDKEEGTKEKTRRKKVSLKKIYLGVKIWLEETAIMGREKLNKTMYWKTRQSPIFSFYKRSYYQLLMGVTGNVKSERGNLLRHLIATFHGKRGGYKRSGIREKSGCQRITWRSRILRSRERGS